MRLDKQEKSQGDHTQQALDELRTTTFHKVHVHEREGEWVGGREGRREEKGGEYTCTCIHVCTLYLEFYKSTCTCVHVYILCTHTCT